MRDLVEGELAPRLLAAPSAAPRRTGPTAPVDADVDVLVELLLSDDPEACVAWIDALRAAGTGDESLRDDLLGPAARRLGERWDADLCDFAQVAIGLGRLQSLVHHLGDDAPRALRRAAGRLLLAKLPGADHLLGAVVVADAFRRAGWDVRFDPCASEAELVEAARAERFDVIGLSVGRDADYPAVRALLAALRAASLNPSATTMAGGPALSRWPALHADLGADLVPADACEAVALADRALRASRDADAPAATPHATPDDAADGRLRRLRRAATTRLAGLLASLAARAA